MKEEYINAFLSPAIMVWQKELQSVLQLTGAEAVSHQFTTDSLTAVIGVSGQLRGNVLYGFDHGTARAVAGKMVGHEVIEFDEMSLSAIGEIANMITGNAATQLSNTGATVDISPPVLIEPAGSKFTTTAGQQILVKFTSDLGPLHIRISLATNFNGG
ncbi:MAG: chemotaxis protein CheX [Dehalococcoidia bacterium]